MKNGGLWPVFGKCRFLITSVLAHQSNSGHGGFWVGPEKWSWWESGSRGGRRRKRRMRTTRRMRRMRTARRKAACCLLPAMLSGAAGPPSKADPAPAEPPAPRLPGQGQLTPGRRWRAVPRVEHNGPTIPVLP